VEHSTGRPANPPIMPGWDGFDVPGYVQQSLAAHVLVDNDVNIMALGERAVSWPETDNMIFLKVATGIGSGIISSGQLQRGADGSAGDVGHIAIGRAAGIACRCGNVGCLEAIAGRPAIAAALRAEGLNLEQDGDVIALVRKGNLRATQIVRQAGRDIGEVLNMCVSVLNPSVIVIGGSMAEVSEQLIAGMREVVYSRSTPLATQHLSIVQARTGADAGVVGAGIMAIDYVLAPENLAVLTAA
jgi:predicted NBD/HSP70 family sugar kinase